MKNLKKTSSKKFKCEFCTMKFSQEKTLLAHICPRKRRFMDKDSKITRIGFMAYTRYYELTMRKLKKPKTLDDFLEFAYYNDFIRFAMFLTDTVKIGRDKYLDWLIKNGVKLSDWYKVGSYNNYLKEFLRKEQAIDAIQRTVEYCDEWAKEYDSSLDKFLKQINTNIFVHNVLTGRISPWFVFLSSRSNDILSRLDEKQLELVYETLNPAVWKPKVKMLKEEATELSYILHQVGL